MSRHTLNIITDSILEKVHQAKIAYGTSTYDLAKAYGVSTSRLPSALREYRQKNNLKPKVSNKELGEAADRVAPNTIPFREFEI